MTNDSNTPAPKSVNSGTTDVNALIAHWRKFWGNERSLPRACRNAAGDLQIDNMAALDEAIELLQVMAELYERSLHIDITVDMTDGVPLVHITGLSPDSKVAVNLVYEDGFQRDVGQVMTYSDRANYDQMVRDAVTEYGEIGVEDADNA